MMKTAPMEGRSPLRRGTFRRHLARECERLWRALEEQGSRPAVPLARLRRAVREEAEAIVEEWASGAGA